MNALTIGSFALIAVLVFIYWLSRIVRREGASQKEKEDREKVNAMVKKHIEREYNGTVGTDGFSVRDKRPWKPNTRT